MCREDFHRRGLQKRRAGFHRLAAGMHHEQIESIIDRGDRTPNGTGRTSRAELLRGVWLDPTSSYFPPPAPRLRPG